MKIQSVSDIITNSSSEVFMMADEKSILKFKKLVENLLHAIGINKPVDEIFKIELTLNDGYYNSAMLDDIILTGKGDCDYGRIEIDCYPLEGVTSETITDEMRKDAMVALNHNVKDYGEYAPAIDDIRITPIDPQYENLANSIYDIVHAFNYEEFNC